MPLGFWCGGSVWRGGGVLGFSVGCLAHKLSAVLGFTQPTGTATLLLIDGLGLTFYPSLGSGNYSLIIIMASSPTQKANPVLEKNLQQVDIQREQLVVFCKRYPIQKLSLFGSILREDFTPVSDIDFLVEFLPNARVGYFEIVRMENELTDLVGRKADLRTPKELSPYFRQNVLNEAVVQYVKD